MKKFLCTTALLFMAGSLAFGQISPDAESLVPSDVNLFVKSLEISKLLRSANYMVFKLMGEEERKDILAARDSFRDKTGIDYLDEKSLSNAGIDTSRPFSFANFDKDTNDDVMLIFLPVFNDREFVLKFAGLIKKTGTGSESINIVTAVYKGITVYQLKKDLYAAPVSGYLVIGSTGDIIRRLIDVRGAGNGSLILDQNYRDYLSKEKNRYDINTFITKRFIMQMNKRPKGSRILGFNIEDDLLLVQGGEALSGNRNDNAYDAIDYISAGLGLDGNKLQMNISVKLTGDSPYTDIILGFLKTGVHQRSLFVPSADTNMFISANVKYLDNLCKGEIDWCQQYNVMKQQVKTLYGIDIEKDFLPYFTGGINLMGIDSGSTGGVGDMLVFVPMTDEKKISDLWSKIRKGIEARYSSSKRFGDEKIADNRAFWYINENQMRIFVSHDRRGIYAGNSVGLMRNGIKSPEVLNADNSGRYGKLINDRTFFLLNVKRNALFRSMMQMQAQGNPGLAKSLDRIGEIFIFCEKRDGLLSADIEIEMKEPVNGK